MKDPAATTFTPNALCFGHDLPAAGMPCHVEVSSSALTIQFTDLPLETIPFPVLSIGAGGFDHDQLIVKWIHNGTHRTLYVKDPILIQSLREAVPLKLAGSLERTAQQVRRIQFRRRTFVWMAGASTLALLVILWFAFDSLIRMAVDRIPMEWEQRIGESARQNLLAGQTVIKEGIAPAAVQRIARRLADQIPNSPYRFEVTLVKSNQINAVALPGGAIIVFTGLLKQSESPEEVAGVLAHEMNHVLLRHGLHGTIRNLGTLVAVKILFGNQEGVVGLAEKLGIQLTSFTFSRQMETEADLAGLDLLHRAQISPSGMIRFFERLSEGDTPQIEMLSTHPMSAARAERLRSRATTLSSQTSEEVMPIELDWKGVTASL